MSKGNLTVTKCFKFDASHYLPKHPKCGRMHGHTYHLEVEIVGSVDENGMIMDFGNIKEHIQPIIDILDHRTLNEVKGLEMPTAENIIIWIKDQIEKKYDNVSRIRLWEGDAGFAEWRAEPSESSLEMTEASRLKDLADRVAVRAAEALQNQIGKRI